MYAGCGGRDTPCPVSHTAHVLREVKRMLVEPPLFALSLYNDTYIHGFKLPKYLKYIKLLSAFIHVMDGGSYS